VAARGARPNDGPAGCDWCPLTITSYSLGGRSIASAGDHEWGRSGADDMVSEGSQRV